MKREKEKNRSKKRDKEKRESKIAICSISLYCIEQ